MRHIFVLNEKAGGHLSQEKLKEELTKINDTDFTYEIVCTEYANHATKIVQEYIEKYGKDEVLRFYACGGDGTINEVASKLVNVENAQLAVIPCGSGNDFVKYFGSEKFSNIKNIIDGEIMPIDILKIGDKYAINVCNFGFDAVVGKTANEVKEKGGKDPYGTGIKKAIFTGMRHKLTVEVDGKIINGKKNMLLCTLANGHYVGGKYKCAPRSIIDDGLIDVCLVDTISIFTFLKLLKPYMAGRHLDLGKKYIHYAQGKQIKLSAKKDFDICLDGEIVTGNSFIVDILHKAINFVVPLD